MRGHKNMAGPCLLGAGAGLMYGRSPARWRSKPPPVHEPARAPRPTATERALALFPSLALGARPQITGAEARDSTRGYGAEVYAVCVYYHVDAGQDLRRLTRLSSLTFPAEVKDWGAVERVEVLFNDGGQADFYLKEGVVVG